MRRKGHLEIGEEKKDKDTERKDKGKEVITLIIKKVKMSIEKGNEGKVQKKNRKKTTRKAESIKLEKG